MRKITKISFVLLMSVLTACATTPKNTVKSEDKKKTSAEINLELGLAYLETKDIQQAKQKFLQAMNQAPTLPEVQYSMAYFFEMTGEKKLANDHYQKAIALAPHRGDTQNNYGTYLCRNGEYQRAISHFKIAVEDPGYLDTAGAYENAGLCALRIPDDSQAINYFKHAVAQDASHEVSLLQVAMLSYKQGDYETARQNLQTYLSVAAPNQETRRLSEKLQRV